MLSCEPTWTELWINNIDTELRINYLDTELQINSYYMDTEL